MFPKDNGLSAKEVEGKQLKYGSNVLPEKPPPSSVSIFIQQLKSPFVYILFASSAVTLAIGHFSDAIVIFFAVSLINLFVK